MAFAWSKSLGYLAQFFGALELNTFMEQEGSALTIIDCTLFYAVATRLNQVCQMFAWKSGPKVSLAVQDGTLRIWDMRPYAPANRCLKIFSGHQHSFEKNLLKCDWSPDGKQVSSCKESDVLGPIKVVLRQDSLGYKRLLLETLSRKDVLAFQTTLLPSLKLLVVIHPLHCFLK